MYNVDKAIISTVTQSLSFWHKQSDNTYSTHLRSGMF